MNTPFVRTRIAVAVASVALVLGAGQAFGAAFALQESSASGLGNAYAGGAAAAEDAATVWSNPAGMSRITTNQLVGGISWIRPSNKFSDGGSLPAVSCPPQLCPPAGQFQPLGGNGGDAGGNNFVPYGYLVIPINKQVSFGLGITVPFGLVTEYDDGWIGRYQALKSDIKTYNVNPAISWKVTDNIAIAAGVDYQQIKATLTANVNYSGALAQAAGAAVAAGQISAATAGALLSQTKGLDSASTVTGDDYSWGWNVGILADLDKNNRFGVAYRSDIKYDVSGNVSFSNPSLPTLVPPQLIPVGALLSGAVNSQALFNSGVTSSIKLPAIANFSWFGHVSDRWDVMADVQWTHWSTIKDLTFVRTTGAVLQSTPENFKDSWRYSLGANYQYDNQWKFRMGVAFDQTPVQDVDRTARLPDNDRTWLSGGVQYALSPAVKLDFSAAYIWVKNASIAQVAKTPTSIAQYGYLSGDYNSNVVIVSSQVTWNF